MDSTQASKNANDMQNFLEHFARIQRIEETVFLVLQVVGGQVLLPILVLVAIFSKRVNRHPIFLNFCISWIISSIFCSLLVYRGRSTAQQLSLNPKTEECLVQAALMNGATALTLCTTLSLNIHLYLILRESICKKSARLSCLGPSTATYILLVFPFFVSIAFTIAAIEVGNKPVIASDGSVDNNLTLAVPTVFYCVILQNADYSNGLGAGFMFLRVVYSLFTAFSIVCFILELMIAALVYYHREKLRSIIANGWIQMLLRVIIFSFYRVVASSLIMALVANPDNVIMIGLSKNSLYNGPVDLMQAAIPLVAFLVFGTEEQFMEVWCFWRRWTRPKQSSNVENVEKSVDTTSTIDISTSTGSLRPATSV